MSGGRPPIFESNDALELKVADYFKYIEGEYHEEKVAKTNKDGSVEEVGKRVYDRHPENPSITGLALFLGFESRQSIYDYESKGEFSYTIKRARMRVEAAYEQHLFSQFPSGAIFALKNFGWTDKVQQEITGKDGGPQEHTHSVKLEIVETGLTPAGSEKEVENSL